MPKVQKVRKHALAHNPYKTSDANSTVNNIQIHEEVKPASDKVLSKGQKRRQEKKSKIMTKIGLISPVFQSTKMKKREEQNALFSELETNLKHSLVAPENPNDGVIKAAADTGMRTNKMKKAVAIRESARMKLVQEHPSFVSDPIAAVNLHLQQMLSNKLAAKQNK
jgi:hypothetical protein